MYSYDNNGIKVCVVYEKGFRVESASKMVKNIANQINARYSISILKSHSPSGLKDFKKTLEDEMKVANANSKDLIQIQKEKLDEVNTILVDNYNKTLAEGEQMDDIKKQADLLDNNSHKIANNAHQLHDVAQGQRNLIYIIGASVVGVI